MFDKIRVLVAIQDDIFLDSLCDYLENISTHFTTERYSSQEALQERVVNPTGIDLVLYEQAMAPEGLFDAWDVILVRFGNENNFELQDRHYMVQLYQGFEGIANSLLRICSEDSRFTGISARAQGDMSAISLFTSPAGGTGKTTLAAATAVRLAALGHRTLYLNLEAISSQDAFFPEQAVLSVSQVFRMAMENSSRLLTSVEGGKGVDSRSGVEYFAGFRDVNDFTVLKDEDISKMVSSLAALGIYEHILLDIQWDFSKLKSVMALADQIFMVTQNTTISVEKVNRIASYIFEKEEPYRHRMQLVLNKVKGSSVNPALKSQYLVAVPEYPLLVDSSDFAPLVLGDTTFSKAIYSIATQIRG